MLEYLLERKIKWSKEADAVRDLDERGDVEENEGGTSGSCVKRDRLDRKMAMKKWNRKLQLTGWVISRK